MVILLSDRLKHFLTFLLDSLAESSSTEWNGELHWLLDCHMRFSDFRFLRVLQLKVFYLLLQSIILVNVLLQNLACFRLSVSLMSVLMVRFSACLVGLKNTLVCPSCVLETFSDNVWANGFQIEGFDIATE